MTQLISSEQSYWLSTEYHKLAFSISQFESRTETCRIPGTSSFAPLPIEELRRRPEEETTALNIISKEIELLEVFYPFANPNEVRNFLWANKYLIEVLFEAHKQIKRVFQKQQRWGGPVVAPGWWGGGGKEGLAALSPDWENGQVVNIHLELHRDPDEDFEELFVVIETNLSPELSLDLLDRFDEEWFLDIADKTEGKLNVTVRPL
ncbi:hypothetical protein HKBW3S43_00562 [Candidatus Hakubella thermalkaliphila]|uniref:Uncharacterized protein n=1 Tax=Candidatus Hakubella thermalkaliphila TaxID=2754717 RepID=A0A6V8P9X6_9ACTN|nr:hypothetical protein [Candidatus Hakubella thermalkaliphila]MBT9167237.1 hypothetical protein [Bacillota bacterium]GFP27741.1 hypothetical protein HKBW3S33_01151 [Candidatus Hakubella thermalkaliphila]GFP34770.1 hypothetical protein HKBW3S43_00562 [Candidatus Hakubella thermalkaliphila]GFP42020.1 hypothetical protein HKBW3C_01146 [Candidatus Hakubella thermalkaliphila]